LSDIGFHVREESDFAREREISIPNGLIGQKRAEVGACTEEEGPLFDLRKIPLNGEAKSK